VDVRPPVRTFAPTTGRRPSAAVQGFSDADLLALGNLGAVRTLASGESFVPDDGTASGCCVVLHGTLELRANDTLAVGVVGRGECIDIAAGGPAPYTLSAREPASVTVVTPLAFELLPPATQRMLDRLAASGAARRFSALAVSHRQSTSRNAQLASRVKDLTVRPSAVLASPLLRQVLAEIPALPVHATDLAFKLLDERTHADDVVASIKNDPALAGLVLKRVNSAYYGLTTKVSDYYHALLLLGTHTVSQLVLESAVTSVMPDLPAARDVQTRAHLTSVLAYDIALVSQAVTPLVASTIGLLHNIGDSVALLIRATRPDAAALIACVEPPALGAAVLAGWGVPERVYEVVARQRLPELLHPDELGTSVADIGVLYLARACHDVLLDGAPAPPHVSEYMVRLGLRETSWDSFCRETIGPALAKRADRLPAAARARLQRGPVGMITTP
jgi:HD-like signal output (HDOD) protein